MKMKSLLGSIGSIAILILVSFTSVVGFQSVKSGSMDDKEINTTTDFSASKELVFKTILEIAHNPDVKQFFKENKQNLLSSNYDYKETFSDLLNQKLTFPITNTYRKSSLSYEYLDSIYNQGIEILNTLGDEKASELLASMEMTNKEFFKELNTIIMNDEELFSSIEQLNRINTEASAITDLYIYPIICVILTIILLAIGFVILAFTLLSELFFNLGYQIGALYLLVTSPIWGPSVILFAILLKIFINLGCSYDPYSLY